MSEAVSEAAARLERAVGRLAELLAQPRPPAGIDPAQVAELAERLDGTLARLRGALVELDGAEPSLHDPHSHDPLPHDALAEDDQPDGETPPPTATTPDEER